MQSATPHHPRNHHNSNHSSGLGVGSGSGTFGPARRGAPRSFVMAGDVERHLRVRAGLAYAIPFAPAVVLLVRERRYRWVRIHAAQSLLFFCLLVLVQVALFAALVFLGGIVETLPAAAAVGLVFYGLYLLAGILGLGFWLRLVADAMSGKNTRFWLLSRGAMRLEETLARHQRLVPALPPSTRP